MGEIDYAAKIEYVTLCQSKSMSTKRDEVGIYHGLTAFIEIYFFLIEQFLSDLRQNTMYFLCNTIL